MPVTYADVWEFWLRYREVAAAVDFITIHILPYWEDFPIPARDAAAHVDAIRSQVAAAFPGKEILIGEFGWPSAGRMREGALPSRANQARVVQEVVALASATNYRVNVIEAYDQPWKRQLEGTVGGHWGLFDAYERQRQIQLGRGGLQPSRLALAGRRRRRARGRDVCRRRGDCAAVPPLRWRRRRWLAIAAMALVSGTLIGWTIENMPHREPRPRRLAAFAGLGRGRRWWRRSPAPPPPHPE